MNIIFSLLINTANADFPINKAKYNQPESWERSPIILLCTNQSIYNKQQVSHALSKWDKNYTIIERSSCNYNLEAGIIKITDGKKINNDKLWALTDYKYSNSSIKSAIVQIKKNTKCKSTDVLIHELGHAIGYEHYNTKHDIMNAKLKC